MFQMGADKAPGPDGFPPGFYQRYWSTVGDSMINFVRKYFLVVHLPLNVNQAAICLIPKVAAPEVLSQFRPISLCNVIVKLVSKILANRLHGVIDKLVGLFQSSYIPVQVALDSIITVQEVIHLLRRQKGCRGGMIIKVDLEKAYDRVDWNFLNWVLYASGFNNTLRGLIMDIITSTELTVH